jgi:TATA-binding protein-associated factor Taf7
VSFKIFSLIFCAELDEKKIAFVDRKLLPAGPAYLAHVHRAINNLSFSEHDAAIEKERQKQMVNGGAGVVEDDLGVGDEEETEELLNQDPKEWKVGCILFEYIYMCVYY